MAKADTAPILAASTMPPPVSMLNPVKPYFFAQHGLYDAEVAHHIRLRFGNKLDIAFSMAAAVAGDSENPATYTVFGLTPAFLRWLPICAVREP